MTDISLYIIEKDLDNTSKPIWTNALYQKTPVENLSNENLVNIAKFLKKKNLPIWSSVIDKEIKRRKL